MRRVAILCMIFILLGVTHIQAYTVNLGNYQDIKETDWGEEAIYFLSVLGVISGYPDQTFQPDGKLSREAFLKMLVEASQIKHRTNDLTFHLNDVNESRWSYPFIEIAFQHGLIDFMISENLLFPEESMSREEVAAIIGKLLLSSRSNEEQTDWRAIGWKQEQSLQSFGDATEIADFIAPEVYFTVHQSIMLGDDTKNFRPKDSLTRREAAVLIQRLIRKIAANHDLDLLGFYAIRSYPNLDKIPLFDHIAYGWSSLEYKTEGSARLSTSGVWGIPEGWEQAVTLAEEHGLKKDLVVFFDNRNRGSNKQLQEFLQDEDAQGDFLVSLGEIVQDLDYGFTGITIDFEGLKDAAIANQYLTFLQKVKDAFPGKSLSVAVPPIYYYKGYDLKGIGEIADTVILMAYDFTDRQTKLPSAPLPLVNDTIEVALKSIPKEKILLGISKQANQWIETEAKTEYYQPAIAAVEERLQQTGVYTNIEYPFFLTKIAFEDDRGKHEIWYEDYMSIPYKILLAKYHGLRGIALWHIGNYTEKDWESISPNYRLLFH